MRRSKGRSLSTVYSNESMFNPELKKKVGKQPIFSGSSNNVMKLFSSKVHGQILLVQDLSATLLFFRERSVDTTPRLVSHGSAHLVGRLNFLTRLYLETLDFVSWASNSICSIFCLLLLLYPSNHQTEYGSDTPRCLRNSGNPDLQHSASSTVFRSISRSLPRASRHPFFTRVENFPSERELPSNSVVIDGQQPATERIFRVHVSAAKAQLQYELQQSRPAVCLSTLPVMTVSNTTDTNIHLVTRLE